MNVPEDVLRMEQCMWPLKGALSMPRCPGLVGWGKRLADINDAAGERARAQFRLAAIKAGHRHALLLRGDGQVAPM
jgi:hypothetical protein